MFWFRQLVWDLLDADPRDNEIIGLPYTGNKIPNLSIKDKL